jgi:sec-independent protein translocase protein TatA
MGSLQPWHWAVIAIVFLALFGYKKLPDATRSVGRSLRIFKSEMKGLHDDLREDDDEPAERPRPTPPSVIEAQPITDAKSTASRTTASAETSRATADSSATPPASGS